MYKRQVLSNVTALVIVLLEPVRDKLNPSISVFNVVIVVLFSNNIVPLVACKLTVNAVTARLNVVPPLLTIVKLSGTEPPVDPEELFTVSVPLVPEFILSVSALPPDTPFSEPSISIAAPAAVAPP